MDVRFPEQMDKVHYLVLKDGSFANALSELGPAVLVSTAVRVRSWRAPRSTPRGGALRRAKPATPAVCRCFPLRPALLIGVPAVGRGEVGG